MVDRRSATIVLTLLSALSCSDSGKGPEKPAVSIAWITKGKCDSFFDISRQGAARAGQNLTAASGRSVQVDLLEPDNACLDAATADAAPTDAPVAGESATVDDGSSPGAPDATPAGTSDGGGSSPCTTGDPQSTLIQQAVSSHVAAIAIDVSNPSCQTPAINVAVAAGIRVITWDSDAPASNRDVYYGSDNVAGTKLAVGVLASLIGGSGKIILQTAMNRDQNGNYQLSSSSTYTDRVKTFNQEILNYPGIQLVATIPCTGTNPLDNFCSKQVEAQLQANPDLKGIFFARGKILREANLSTAAPLFTAAMVQAKTLHAVAFDAPADAVDNIKAGYADLVLNQKLWGWGYEVVTLAYEMVTNNRQVPIFFDSGFDEVCPNNIDQFITYTQTQDFLQPLAKCQY